MNSESSKNGGLNPYFVWGTSALVSFGFYFFLLIVFRILQPDLDEHIVISENMFKDWHVPAHPLFYFLVQLLSFFTRNLNLEIWAAFVVFSMAQVLKLRFSQLLIEEAFGYKLDLFSFLVLILIQFIISFSAFENYFIVNQISPNYFHNGTLQLSIPFAILLFREALRFEKSREEAPTIRKMVLFGLIMGLAKPSFLFCFIPVFPAYIFYTSGIGRKLLGSLQVSTLFTFLVIGQSYYLRVNPPNYVTSFKVLFMPFYQFGSLGSHLTMILMGCLPVILGCLLEPGILKDKRFHFLMAMLGLAYLISFLFVDMINGALFSNMTWQTTVVLYILIIMVFGKLFRPDSKMEGLKRIAFSVLILIQVGYTAFYLFHAISMHTLFI
jgi:hypothetical protein